MEEESFVVVKKWVTKAGYEAEVVFCDWLGGFHCGYVTLDEDHACFDKDYNHMEDCYDVSVHGGLTYSRKGKDASKWVVGFDCNHCWDLPKYNDTHGIRGEDATFKDEDYVVKECESLAKQLLDIQMSDERVIIIDGEKRKISVADYKKLFNNTSCIKEK